MDTELTEQLLYAVAVEAVGASTLPRGECSVLVTMWDQRHGACVVGPGPALETAALPADPGPHGRRSGPPRPAGSGVEGALSLSLRIASGWVPGAPALCGQSPCLLSCPTISRSLTLPPPPSTGSVPEAQRPPGGGFKTSFFGEKHPPGKRTFFWSA